MEEQLGAHKLKYCRVAAVNGAQIDPQQKPYWTDPRRSHLGAAETACLLSHIKAWRLITQGAGQHGLVLEDDIHVSEDFGDLISGLSLDPKEFCVHKLETFRANVTLMRRPAYTVRNRKAYKLATNHGGAGAYILSKETASHLLDYIELFDEAVDIELFEPNRRKFNNLTIYQWIPAPCIQDFLVGEPQHKKSFASNIGKDRADQRSQFIGKPRSKLTWICKARLRTLYTKLYSAWLFPRGQMRKRIQFR
jgi:glycosyl transferase, family 25